MAKKVSFPIPEPPADSSPQMKRMLGAVKEALEVRLGRRGDPLEQAVTKRDLVDGGIAKLGGLGGNGPLGPVMVEPEEARITPPLPIAFQAIGIFGGVTLTWDTPFRQYNVHAFTEVWRAESTDREAPDGKGVRILMSSSRGEIYFDRIPDGGVTTYYYWIRFISEYNREGPFSLPMVATKQADVSEILSTLSNSLQDEPVDLGAPDETLILNAKRFAVKVGSGSAAVYPLIIADVDGVPTVVLDTVLIREASIQEGKLGPITFGKLVDGDGNTVTTVAGKLRVDMIDVASLQVTDAMISGVIRSTQVASNGQPRWMLDKNGGMAFNSSNGNGRMEIRDNVMKFFSAAGIRRIQIGDLTL